MAPADIMEPMEFCISTNIDRQINVADWYQAVAAAGFRTLSLNRDTAHCSYEKATGRLQLIAEAKRFDLSYSLLFVPFGSDYDITCTHGETRMGAVCAIANAMHAAQVLGCSAIVLSVTHALPTRHGSDTSSALVSLTDLVETAENMRINLLLKNLIDSASLETLEAALAEFPSPRLGVCYNPALDLLSGQPPYRLLETQANRILALQLADTDRRTPRNRMMFTGLVDWHRLAAFLSIAPRMPLHLDIDVTPEVTAGEHLASLRTAADRLVELMHAV